ncbi:MAG: rhodanese-like domain-containing protein [FCB group bacterium]|jgi:rhodanese-related sulfurtransferase|nr:rhodanese-like domain-containing protein [FCB group bacterium]
MADDARCTPSELAELLERGEDFCLLDVRTEQELEIARVDGCAHIPLNELPARLDEIEPWRHKLIVTLCHHGMRSQTAQEYLISNGFSRVSNLSGGIDAYAAEVDPTLNRY